MMDSKLKINGMLLASLFVLGMTLAPLPQLAVTADAATKTVKNTKKTTAAKNSNSFETPDFAFPQTVGKNARTALDNAFKTNNGTRAIQAAIQLCISDTQISGDSCAKAVATLDEVADRFGAPYNALAYMLEARLYSDIYSTQMYVFNSRKLPATPVPENVFEWSGDMFRNRICSLVEKAFSIADTSAPMPLADIRVLLTNADDAVAEGFTISDFIAIRADELLGMFGGNSGPVIPFGTKAAGSPADNVPGQAAALRSALIEKAIARHASDSNPNAEAYFCRLKLNTLSGAEYNSWLKACYDRFVSTPAGAAFVVDYSSTLGKRRERYELLEQYRKSFPSAPQIGLVESELNELSAKSLDVSFPSQILPDTPTQVMLTGANLYNGYVLVYAMPGHDTYNSTTYAQLSGLKPIMSLPVEIVGSTPDRVDTVLTVPALKPGLYAFVPSVTADASGRLVKNPKYHLNLTNVSDLSVFSTSSLFDSGRSLYVTSAYNQKPIAGAKVTLREIKSGRRGASLVKTTDSEGKVEIPSESFYYLAEYNGNYYDGMLYSSRASKYDDKEKLYTSVLTDLSIYHPGDTVQFEAVAYTSLDRKMRVAANRTFDIVLSDANSQPVDTVRLNSDSLGRLSSKFTLPKSGMLGRWLITAREGSTWTGSASLQVADYKSPTFLVSVESTGDAAEPGDDVKFKGRAVTYAGMPVGNAKVAYTVQYKPMWWKAMAAGGTYGGETTTDADGTFTISLPTAGLKGTPYAQGAFSLTADVTSPAGETQSSTPVTFSIGKSFYINPVIPETINASDSDGKFSVQVLDIAGASVKKPVYYEISAEGKTVKNGEFDAPQFVADLAAFKSGRYAFRFSLNQEFKSDSICQVSTDSVTIWRPDDKRPPVETPLWIPVKEYKMQSGAKNVKVRVGSSYKDSHILALTSDSRQLLESKWLEVSDGFVTVPVDGPADNERTYVTFIGEHNLNSVSEKVTVIPYEQTTKLNITTESFRDRIEPGARESWRFKFDVAGQPCANMAVSAVMTNKALNAIAPFQWSFNPTTMLYWSPSARLSFSNPFNTSNSGSMTSGVKVSEVKYFTAPEWNTYDMPLYSGAHGVYLPRYLATARNVQMRGAAKMSAGAVNMASVKNEMAESAADEEAPMEGADYGGVAMTETETESETLRQVNVPLAFFKPDLVTDANGVATVDFTTPEFVGTWQFQVMGYTPELKGNVLTLDAVAAKKVMVQMNAPRFVRTGDKVSFAATAYNNTDAAAPVSVRIELVDAVTGETLLNSVSDPVEVVASASRTVNAMMQIPSDINALIVRAYAEIPGHRDGEQTAVPVLPSSTPLVESTPFYIPSSQSAYEVKLPKFDKDAKVTLTYCDNPAWECVTALPGILKPESVNTLARIYALYGNAVAGGLFGKYPSLVKGVQTLAADSALVSPLERNPELKTVMLNNTPWVNDAQAETLRMQSLVEYADPKKASAAVKELLKTITDSQNADGGWSWCPDMKSSTFITGRVLHVFASLADMGFMPDGADKALKSAFKYMDNEYAREWNDSKRKNIPVESLLSYLTDKSAFAGIGATSSFQPLDAAAMKAIQSGWRKFGIEDKATAAILFERRKMSTLARTLLESLRQFASVSPEKGMWFDNLSNQYNPSSTLLTTARVLEAYNLIEPKSEAVEQLRQWLIISKQTQNWGDDRRTAEAVCAILTSDGGVPSVSASPQISLNGKKLEVAASPVTGSVTLNLDPVSASNATLSVARSASGPAWGGVVAQYVAPILDVKAQSIPQLSVEKNVYVVKSGADGSSATAGDYAVGDKVRVTLTIVCDRDLDYVAITDPRAACLEPVNQLSGYTSSDGVWYYREVRDAQTNLFIPYLSKGTHVISYECTVDRKGDYSLGVAAAQSQYAPTITAHSAGAKLQSR